MATSIEALDALKQEVIVEHATVVEADNDTERGRRQALQWVMLRCDAALTRERAAGA